LNVLAVSGSLNKNSVTRVVITYIADTLRQQGCHVDVLDFLDEPLSLFNPDESHLKTGYSLLQQRVDKADVYVLGTPDYHGSMSSAMKNFLDHFWHEFAGKLFMPLVSSHEKGLTVIDQIRTVARQCYAWALPYAISFTEGDDVKEGKIASEQFQRRLEMMVRDLRVYGELLARQRSADLAGSEPGFMARHRNGH
jgi:FMN reductase